MEIQADITDADHRALLDHEVRRIRAARRRLPFGALTVGWLALVVLFTWMYTATSLKPAYILSGGIGFVLALVAFAAVTRATREPATSPSLGTRTLRPEAEGLRVRGADFETWLSWDAVRAVEETDEHLFVRSDHLPVIIVPRRAFASSEEGEAFAALLRQRGERNG